MNSNGRARRQARHPLVRGPGPAMQRSPGALSLLRCRTNGSIVRPTMSARTSKLLLLTSLFGCGAQPTPTPLKTTTPAPLSTGAVAPPATMSPPRDDGRLPANVRPVRYALHLSVDP